jgi:hypothetical protein
MYGPHDKWRPIVDDRGQSAWKMHGPDDHPIFGPENSTGGGNDPDRPQGGSGSVSTFPSWSTIENPIKPYQYQFTNQTFEKQGQLPNSTPTVFKGTKRTLFPTFEKQGQLPNSTSTLASEVKPQGQVPNQNQTIENNSTSTLANEVKPQGQVPNQNQTIENNSTSKLASEVNPQGVKPENPMSEALELMEKIRAILKGQPSGEPPTSYLVGRLQPLLVRFRQLVKSLSPADQNRLRQVWNELEAPEEKLPQELWQSAKDSIDDDMPHLEDEHGNRVNGNRVSPKPESSGSPKPESSGHTSDSAMMVLMQLESNMIRLTEKIQEETRKYIEGRMPKLFERLKRHLKYVSSKDLIMLRKSFPKVFEALAKFDQEVVKPKNKEDDVSQPNPKSDQKVVKPENREDDVSPPNPKSSSTVVIRSDIDSFSIWKKERERAAKSGFKLESSRPNVIFAPRNPSEHDFYTGHKNQKLLKWRNQMYDSMSPIPLPIIEKPKGIIAAATHQSRVIFNTALNTPKGISAGLVANALRNQSPAFWGTVIRSSFFSAVATRMGWIYYPPRQRMALVCVKDLPEDVDYTFVTPPHDLPISSNKSSIMNHTAIEDGTTTLVIEVNAKDRSTKCFNDSSHTTSHSDLWSNMGNTTLAQTALKNVATDVALELNHIKTTEPNLTTLAVSVLAECASKIKFLTKSMAMLILGGAFPGIDVKPLLNHAFDGQGRFDSLTDAIFTAPLSIDAGAATFVAVDAFFSRSAYSLTANYYQQIQMGLQDAIPKTVDELGKKAGQEVKAPGTPGVNSVPIGVLPIEKEMRTNKVIQDEISINPTLFLESITTVTEWMNFSMKQFLDSKELDPLTKMFHMALFNQMHINSVNGKMRRLSGHEITLAMVQAYITTKEWFRDGVELKLDAIPEKTTAFANLYNQVVDSTASANLSKQVLDSYAFDLDYFKNMMKRIPYVIKLLIEGQPTALQVIFGSRDPVTVEDLKTLENMKQIHDIIFEAAKIRKPNENVLTHVRDAFTIVLNGLGHSLTAQLWRKGIPKSIAATEFIALFEHLQDIVTKTAQPSDVRHPPPLPPPVIQEFLASRTPAIPQPPATITGGKPPATITGGKPPATITGGKPPATITGGKPPATITAHGGGKQRAIKGNY